MKFRTLDTVEVLNIESERSDFSSSTAKVLVRCAIDGGSPIDLTYFVQTCGGDYLSQMGCTVEGSTGDADHLTQDELLAYAALGGSIIKAAEGAVSYDWHELDLFNCAISNSGSTIVAIEKGPGEFYLSKLNQNFNPVMESGRRFTVYGRCFESLEGCRSYIAQFRTDDHYDLKGLASALSHLESLGELDENE